jgi:hypothetical protein
MEGLMNSKEVTIVLIDHMTKLCESKEFRKSVGIPEIDLIIDEDSFFEGVIHGMDLVKVLIMSLDGMTLYAPKDLDSIVDKLSGPHDNAG